MQFHRGVEDAMGEGTRGREEEGLVWVAALGLVAGFPSQARDSLEPTGK